MNWLLAQAGPLEGIGAISSTSRGTLLTGDPSTPNLKGPWSQLIASTVREAHGVWVQLVAGIGDTDGVRYVIDLGIGASSSEIVIIPNMLVETPTGTGADGQACGWHYFPVSIPAGTRVSARVGTSTTSRELFITCQLESKTFTTPPIGTRIIDYGAGGGDGTPIDPGATIHTKGSYVEIIASTTERIRKLVVDNSSDTASARVTIALTDIAIGAAASEQVIIENIAWNVSTGEKIMCFPMEFLVDIPSGTRISVRSQSSINDSADRVHKIILYGIE